MMMTNRVLYDLFATFYAMSLVLLFFDAIQPRRAINRSALVIMFIVFLLETVFLLTRLRALGYVPVYSQFDATLLLSWLILLVALCVNAFFRVDLLLFFANVLGFALVAFDTFSRQAQWLYTARQGDLLALHVTFALMSYAAFSFAFVFSVMYLVQNRFLRAKQWNRWYFRLASLEALDLYAYRSILFGIPLLLVAIVLGTVWEKVALGHFLLLDPKPIATAVLWLMYGVYLTLRLRSGWGGHKLAWYCVVCFGCVVVNFWIIGSFSIFHHGK